MRKLKLNELNRVSVEEFKALEKLSVIVVLDNIRSAHNVGSIFRTCDALGIRSISLTGITARPPHKEITKAAIGATDSVNWNYNESNLERVLELKEQGYKIIGVEQTTESILLKDYFDDFDEDELITLVFGNEVKGVSDELLPLMDTCIEIEQFGTKHSFNVAISAGIVLYEFSKNMRKK